MSGWMFVGSRPYTSKNLQGYKCLHCGWEIWKEHTLQLPRYCPKCGNDKKVMEIRRAKE